MKYKQVIEIVTETYEEEQYILHKFPEAYWYSRGSNIVFALPAYEQNRVGEAIEDFERLKREAGVK
jgi:hypothetical protein